MLRTRRRKTVAALSVAALAAGVTVAVAAWLVSIDNAPAHGQVGSLQGTVTAVEPAGFPATGRCFPNSTCAAVFKLNNTSGGPLQITQIQLASTPSFQVFPGTSIGPCANADLAPTVGVNVGPVTPPVVVPTGENEITVPASYLTTDIPSDCQGAQFRLDAKLILSS